MEINQNIEIHASSGIRPDYKSQWVDWARRGSPNHGKKEGWQVLTEIDLSKDEKHRKMVDVVKEDLETQYLQVGIDVKEEDFPDISLIDPTKIQRFLGVGSVGSAGKLENRATIYLMGDDNLLLDIKTTHHEVDHELGRDLTVVNEKGELKAVQLGFHSTPKDGINRGEVLEEGVMEYLATEFVLNSNSEICTAARKSFALKVRRELTDQTDSPASMDETKIRELCLSGIEKEEPEKYRSARLLIETLIIGAQRLDPEEGHRMREDLLKTRVKTAGTRSLMDRVDKLFGSGTYSGILRLNFKDVNEIEKYTNKLRATANLQAI